MTDHELAQKIHDIVAKEFHGDSIAESLVKAARDADLPVSLACALCEQESGFKNIFGHDRTIFAGAGKVTRAKYRAYKSERGHSRMQGVGPVQLTWWEYQDAADALGGCWKPYYNMLVGFKALASNIRAHGHHDGIRRYNGSGSAAERYANSVTALQRKWHARLT
jgi:hypothetical protein